MTFAAVDNTAVGADDSCLGMLGHFEVCAAVVQAGQAVEAEAAVPQLVAA